MGVPSPMMPTRTKKTKAAEGTIPTVDMSTSRSTLSESIVKACEEYGFFKVVNHGVSKETIQRLEAEGSGFFAKPAEEKQRARPGPATPFGYGSKNIGRNGDMGDVEYLLLQPNSLSLSHCSNAISDDPAKFRRAVNEYTESVKELACEILDLVGEGVGMSDKLSFSRLIRDVQSDSLVRLNHYPPVTLGHSHTLNVGFGEHSDPQILTILRSNDVPGLQIALPNHHHHLWVPVAPDPHHFYVFVGDVLEVLTNGRFRSVRHRVMTNSTRTRTSTMFFGAPPLSSWIYPLPDFVSPLNPALYTPFTWAHFKKAAFSLRLADSRLDLFKTHHHPHHLPLLHPQ